VNASWIYADFQSLDDENRMKLICAGTLKDLERLGIKLREGLGLAFYTDADEARPDELRIEGVREANCGNELCRPNCRRRKRLGKFVSRPPGTPPPT
jgi:hypothetical protein